MAASLLSRGLAELRHQGLPGDDTAWDGLQKRLEQYLREIELWNPRLGLVEAIGDELVAKHILDSLASFGPLIALLELRNPGVPMAMADIGSGAGLPGIPLLLAIECLLPDRAAQFSMHLVEKQQRRVGFLLNAKAVLGLDHLILHQEKLENLVKAGLSFDLVCARAFSPLDAATLAALRAILSSDGRLFLYKGRSIKIDQELQESGLIRRDLPESVDPMKLADQSVDIGPNSALVVRLAVPFLADERHLLIIPPGAGAC